MITKEQLKEALNIQARQGGNLRNILLETNQLDERTWMALLSQEFGIPSLHLAQYKIEPDLLRLLPEELARKYQMVPISKLGDALVIAVVEPLDVVLLDDLKRMTGCKIEMVLASEREIKQTMDRYYGEVTSKLTQVIEEAAQAPQEGVSLELLQHEAPVQELAPEAQEAPIIRLVDAIISEGLRRRASDIHVEPYEDQMRIRYRVDGALQEAVSLPKRQQNAVLARIKLISGMEITESRIPQDGRFKIKFQNREIDFRVSILPIAHGGKVVMRILDKGILCVGLDQLGLSEDALKKFQEATAKPFGMILLSGPTGSGKSTTLYSILAQLNIPDRNIITTEDPVEYQIDGMTQIQIRPEIGLTFANSLRALLRQSPDVVMVGEIRDFETADIAIKASLTGQLVLSTLHTNDAPGAMTRLIDMGVEPFLIASSVVLVAGQRLCRRVCQQCKQTIEPDWEWVKKMGFVPEKLKGKVFYKGMGCQQCHKTGYRGRMAILEVLLVDDRIREMIISNVSSDTIRQYAVEYQGMKTLREDGLLKCFLGLTTLEEVVRITSEE